MPIMSAALADVWLEAAKHLHPVAVKLDLVVRCPWGRVDCDPLHPNSGEHLEHVEHLPAVRVLAPGTLVKDSVHCRSISAEPVTESNTDKWNSMQ